MLIHIKSWCILDPPNLHTWGGSLASGLVPRLLSIVSGNQANPNESVLAEAVTSHMHRTVYLQIMTWLWENGTYVLCNIFFVDD